MQDPTLGKSQVRTPPRVSRAMNGDGTKFQPWTPAHPTDSLANLVTDSAAYLAADSAADSTAALSEDLPAALSADLPEDPDASPHFSSLSPPQTYMSPV